ncbi:MAG: hypothetical protein LC722_05540 [Actinobacteria bacterium]|nr:hypothetical protein [Actinomycetota bacterium]
MPELPDVEHLRRRWEAHAPGARSLRTVVTDPGILRNTEPAALDAAVRGERFEAPERLGKWLLARTTGPTIVLHFGMDGGLRWAESGEGRHRHDRVIFETDRGEMRFRNMFASGIGNLIADEVLWQARLHPKARLQELDDASIAELARAVRAVLSRAVTRYDYVSRNRSWLLHVRGRPGASCPRCGTPLARILAAGRTTWSCPACQPDPDAKRRAPKDAPRSRGPGR